MQVGPKLFAAILGAIVASMGAQTVFADCAAPTAKHIRQSPYDFVVSSRVDERSDYKLAITCVQNDVPGYFRFNWHIPQHKVDFEGRGFHENPRPIAKEDKLLLQPGCFSFGNLSDSDRSEFYAHADQKDEIDKEKNRSCLGNVNYLVPVPNRASSISPESVKPIIPGKINYNVDTKFFALDPKEVKSVTHLFFEIFFASDEKSKGTVTLTYSVKESPVSLEKIGFVLRPIANEGSVEKALIAASFREPKKIRDKEDKFSWNYSISPKSKFGSAALGIFDLKGINYANIWVPVIYER